MSARLYKKALKEKEQIKNVQANVVAEELQDTIEEDESDSVAPSVNLFDLLNDYDGIHESEQYDEPNEGDDGLVIKADCHVAEGAKAKKKSKKKKKNSKNGLKSHQLKSTILNVNSKLLNAENELRRIFGSKVVKQFEHANQTGTSNRGHGGKRRGYAHRKSLLASPSEHWPRWDGSLSMELLENKNGYHYFRYVRSASYIQAQSAYEFSKIIDDLNGVATNVMHHPYHVESLLTLADYFRFSGEYQTASDFIAKCLYALEYAWHPMFSPSNGNCRLDYTHETNKPFFVSLFNHMRNLDRRGCHRSALEVCKFLLSLDPTDPMGAIFCIDYFSLRAEEYAWLEQFSEEYPSSNSLWTFPNFAYSLAICRFYLENEASSKETAVGLMKQALTVHPSVLKRLVEKVPLNDQAWTAITNTSIFTSEDTGIRSLDHLIRIYVERSYIIWRLPDVHKLLKDAALQVVETLNHDSGEIDTWACVRKEAFPSEKNEYGHLLVSDFSDSGTILPPEDLENLLMIDPWMEDMEENEYQGSRGPVRGSRELANRSPLAMLLESILPWVHFETDAGGNHDQPQEDH
ncbi:uncharacterized protein LOC141611576 [Silene latifolia]|uniref:uncharacterized protein LOC141611576 n=1 Tax=Silene latifolia TaxID=37657 RepID=UPI003D788097